MKKTTLILFSFFVVFYLNAQNKQEYLILDKDTFYILPKKFDYLQFTNISGILNMDSLIDGKYVQLKDSSIVAKFSLKNMFLNGDFVYYYNGIIRESGFYINGAKSNIWRSYNYENGNIFGLYYYKDNFNSEYEVYYENGQIKNRGITIEVGDDYKTGEAYKIFLSTDWYLNGFKMNQGLVKIGSNCSTNNNCGNYKKWQYWYSNGILEKYGNFKNAKLDGEWFYNDTLGNVRKIETYKSGNLIKSVEYIKRRNNSIEISKTIYFNSKKQIYKTIIETYLENGLVEIEKFDKNGKLKK